MSIYTLTRPSTPAVNSEQHRYEFYNRILERWFLFQEGIFSERSTSCNRVRVELSLVEDTILMTLIYCCEGAVADNYCNDTHTLVEHAALVGFNEPVTTSSLAQVRRYVSFGATVERWERHEQEERTAGVTG